MCVVCVNVRKYIHIYSTLFHVVEVLEVECDFCNIFVMENG